MRKTIKIGPFVRKWSVSYPHTPSKHRPALHFPLGNASRLDTVKTDQGLFSGAVHHHPGDTPIPTEVPLNLLVVQSIHPSNPDGVDGRHLAKPNLKHKHSNSNEKMTYWREDFTSRQFPPLWLAHLLHENLRSDQQCISSDLINTLMSRQVIRLTRTTNKRNLSQPCLSQTKFPGFFLMRIIFLWPYKYKMSDR